MKKKYKGFLRKTIYEALVVEDNEICQRVLQYQLTYLNYRIDLASDASTAMQKLRNKTYDLIVTDLGLPDQSGKSVVESVRHCEYNQSTPLLVISAHVDKESIEECLALGANVILTKPATIDVLEKVLKGIFKAYLS